MLQKLMKKLQGEATFKCDFFSSKPSFLKHLESTFKVFIQRNVWATCTFLISFSISILSKLHEVHAREILHPTYTVHILKSLLFFAQI